jgi:anti-sigma B factor antagonist
VDVRRTLVGGTLHMTVGGRVDAYWSDDLDAALTDAVAEGHHRIALNCSSVDFLSSAGIGVIVQHYKALAAINGALTVVEPSRAVLTVLRMSNLVELLTSVPPESVVPAGAPAPSSPTRRVQTEDAALEVFELGAANTLTCRAVGNADALATGGFTGDQSVSLAGLSPAFAIGIGALGECFADCRARFGELISVAGATAYQPADGTNVADYLVARGPLATDVRLLYGLVCEGAFSHLIRFEAARREGVRLSQLTAACCDIAGSDALGVVVVAETAGLVGAALRRSRRPALISSPTPRCARGCRSPWNRHSRGAFRLRPASCVRSRR